MEDTSDALTDESAQIFEDGCLRGVFKLSGSSSDI